MSILLLGVLNVEIQCTFHAYSTCEFGLATFFALSSHMGLVVTYWTVQIQRVNVTLIKIAAYIFVDNNMLIPKSAWIV